MSKPPISPHKSTAPVPSIPAPAAAVIAYPTPAAIVGGKPVVSYAPPSSSSSVGVDRYGDGFGNSNGNSNSGSGSSGSGRNTGQYQHRPGGSGRYDRSDSLREEEGEEEGVQYDYDSIPAPPPPPPPATTVTQIRYCTALSPSVPAKPSDQPLISQETGEQTSPPPNYDPPLDWDLRSDPCSPSSSISMSDCSTPPDMSPVHSIEYPAWLQQEPEPEAEAEPGSPTPSHESRPGGAAGRSYGLDRSAEKLKDGLRKGQGVEGQGEQEEEGDEEDDQSFLLIQQYYNDHHLNKMTF